MRFTPENIEELQPGEVFVFGSNTGGRHGAGAAKTALAFGAVEGRGSGRSGDTYAIPTKRFPGFTTLRLHEIYPYVHEFAEHCCEAPAGTTFIVTKIGCGLAGYRVEEVAPLFFNAFGATFTENVVFPEEFHEVFASLEEHEYQVPVVRFEYQKPELLTVGMWPGVNIDNYPLEASMGWYAACRKRGTNATPLSYWAKRIAK